MRIPIVKLMRTRYWMGGARVEGDRPYTRSRSSALEHLRTSIIPVNICQ